MTKDLALVLVPILVLILVLVLVLECPNRAFRLAMRLGCVQAAFYYVVASCFVGISMFSSVLTL